LLSITICRSLAFDHFTFILSIRVGPFFLPRSPDTKFFYSSSRRRSSIPHAGRNYYSVEDQREGKGRKDQRGGDIQPKSNLEISTLGSRRAVQKAKMVNKIMGALVAVDGLFVIMGAVMMAFSVVNMNTAYNTPTDGVNAAENLLYQQFPLTGRWWLWLRLCQDHCIANKITAGIVNAAFTFFVFLVTIPAMMNSSRGLLKFVGYLVVLDAVFTMIIGLDLWVITLTTKEELGIIWSQQSAATQDLLQTEVSYMQSNVPGEQQPLTHVAV
jgi:hypothetical protein